MKNPFILVLLLFFGILIPCWALLSFSMAFSATNGALGAPFSSEMSLPPITPELASQMVDKVGFIGRAVVFLGRFLTSLGEILGKAKKSLVFLVLFAGHCGLR